MRAKLFVTAALASVAGTLIVAAPSASAESTTSAFTSRLVTLVNQARAQHGLRALSVAGGTSTVASGWSSHMASTNTLAHNPNLQSQLEAHGSPNWTTYGENVGEGPSSSADKLFTAYMNSPEHKANILGSGYRYLGIATVFSSGVAWNTMDFVDQYGSTTTTTTTMQHHTATVTHHVTTSAPKPAARPAVHKAVARPAARHHKLTRHRVAAQHVHASHHVDSNRPYTDMLLASGQPTLVAATTGHGNSDTTRLIASLLAAALIAMVGISWGTRRRVVA
ncbi:MAG: hypothetical protein QOG34_1310 [Frankiaceae bacterium]|nr:hypothetical protein [Frankiaceae bacterium]